MRAFTTGLSVALLVLLSPAYSDELDVSGDIELQTRAFLQSPVWPGQSGASVQGTLAATAELRWRSEEGDQRASLIPYLRWDSVDSDRSLLDLKEAYWALEDDDFELLIGANTVFWGVTESVHLVDIINQTDFASDLDGEDKLGQPMISLTLQRDWGEVSAFVLPYFRERTFAGRDGRLRPPLAVDADAALYASSDEEHHLDFALRYSHYFGDVDVGVHAFSGTSREPFFVPSANGESLLPFYDQIVQFGVDLQYTKDAWLWKLEAIARDGFSHSYIAAVGGFEYTVYQLRESDSDLGLLIEYQYDGRNAQEPVTLSDNDVFVAARLARNDIHDTAILAGLSYDTDTGETFFNVEAERRFGEDWFAELRVRFFAGASPGDTTYWLRDDDYLQLNIARYF